MTITKKIEHILSPPALHMVGDGFKVHGFLPSSSLGEARMSPFFLLDYLVKNEFPPSTKPKGVGVHPHRGFETVTLVYHGEIAHHDSAGNSGVISEGDVQWMTAASGILHKEYHGEKLTKTGGLIQGVQLWVNLPARDKMSPPKYQALLRQDLGQYHLPNDGGVINVVAGDYKGTKGPASTFTPLHVYSIRLNSGATFDMSFPEHYNTCVLMIEGEAQMNGQMVPEDHLALFENKGTEITVKTESPSTILLLSGEPIDEPIVQYGPFLMNTQEEIAQAMQDFNDGKFGHLED